MTVASTHAPVVLEPVVLEPESQAFVEATAKPPFISQAIAALRGALSAG